MSRKAIHRTYMDIQLWKFEQTTCELFPLIPRASGERIVVRGFERTDRRTTCWAAQVVTR
jgi:hypothetical protein